MPYSKDDNVTKSGLVMSRIASLPVLMALAYTLYIYPFARAELSIAIISYVIVGYWRPQWMMFCIPVWLALVNLAPWSGSLHLEDYDFLMGATLLVFLLRGEYTFNIGLSLIQRIAIGLMMASVLIGFFRGFLPMPEWEPLEISTYYSHWNAVRLSKSFFWVILLLPGLAFMARERSDKTQVCLIWGMALAGAVVGLAAMWERQVFHAISESGTRYQIIGNLLDFTTPYRITGLFSEMHTGGEAIDGFMALTWPFGLLAFLISRSLIKGTVASLALMLALYALVTTFSRASYLALAMGLLSGGLIALHVWRKKHSLTGQRFGLLMATLAIPLVLAYVHTRGGVVSLGAALTSWGLSVVLGYAMSRQRRAFVLLSQLFLGGAGTYITAHGMLTSKWVVNSPQFAWTLAFVLALLAVSGGYATGKRLKTLVSPKSLSMLLLLTVGGVCVVVPALLGSRMETRLSTNRQDVGLRSGHWQHALDIMKSDWGTKLFGMGIGRFPEEYLFAYSSAHGNYGFKKESGKVVLELGGGEDLTFAQRVQLPAWRTYTLTMDVRTNDDLVNLRARICRRHILVPYDWNPQCVSMTKVLKNTHGEWQKIEWTFPISSLGDGAAFGRRPLVFELMNYQYRGDQRVGTKLDIQSVSILDDRGAERLKNGDFSLGLARWFPYYDFEHLPWHIKNLWVNLYFDQGWFGVAGFMTLLLGFAGSAIRRSLKSDVLGWGVTSAIVSYLTVGLVGGLIDVPRVVLLFYLILLFVAISGNTSENRLNMMKEERPR